MVFIFILLAFFKKDLLLSFFIDIWNHGKIIVAVLIGNCTAGRVSWHSFVLLSNVHKLLLFYFFILFVFGCLKLLSDIDLNVLLLVQVKHWQTVQLFKIVRQCKTLLKHLLIQIFLLILRYFEHIVILSPRFLIMKCTYHIFNIAFSIYRPVLHVSFNLFFYELPSSYSQFTCNLRTNFIIFINHLIRFTQLKASKYILVHILFLSNEIWK